MKNKQSQSGSGHLVIIILIVLVILGGLGFAYYTNFMKPKADDEKTKVDEKAQVVDSKTVSINPSATAPIYFTYPGDWTVESSKSDGVDEISAKSGSDDIKIYSPTKKYMLI